MENFSQTELKILDLIRAGKSRNEIILSGIIAEGSLRTAFSKIYEKTDNYVNYHTERNKFEELSAYLRNNPNAPFLPLSEAAPDNNGNKEEFKEECNQSSGQLSTEGHERVEEVKEIKEGKAETVSKETQTQDSIMQELKNVLDEIGAELQDEKMALEVKEGFLCNIYARLVCKGLIE